MAKLKITQSAPPKATVGINGWSILRHPSSRAEPPHGGHLRKTGQRVSRVREPSAVRSLSHARLARLGEPARM